MIYSYEECLAMKCITLSLLVVVRLTVMVRLLCRKGTGAAIEG
jgi:hypothetical protein